MKVWAPKTAYRAKQDGTWDGIAEEIASLSDQDELAVWRSDFVLRRHRDLPPHWQEVIFDALAERETDFLHASMDAEFSATVGRPAGLTTPRTTA